ncbi:MAG: sigma-70 family RNA polymerase sigma factor [Clostridiales bacterium]|nr:sigma-70 family RNA polymerase sigma factor [Clostridiales bacterium]
MNREERAFIKNLYINYSNYLYNIALRTTHNKELAMEILQETFLIASSKVSVLYNHPNQVAWLCKTLNSKIKEVTRSKKIKINNSLVKIEIFDLFDSKISNFIEKNFVTDTYFDELKNTDFIDKLKNILTEKEIEFIKYKYINELSNKEIAEKLGMSYTAVTTTGTRINKKLKKFYKKK